MTDTSLNTSPDEGIRFWNKDGRTLGVIVQGGGLVQATYGMVTSLLEEAGYVEGRAGSDPDQLPLF